MRYLLLTLLFPSLGIAVANGYAPGLVPLLLGAYYTCPLLLYRTGRLFRLPWRPAVPVEGLVLLLPYLPYWLYAGSSATPLWRAYRAFFWGPGLAIPITLFLLAPWGLELPGWAVAAVTLGLALIVERILRRPGCLKSGPTAGNLQKGVPPKEEYAQTDQDHGVP